MERTHKEKVAIAIKKAESHLSKVRSLIEEDASCFAIMQQNLAAIGLLKSVNLLMLEGHIDREIGRHGGPASKQLQSLKTEILKVVKTSQNK